MENMHNSMLYSFDVFDTCLSRTCGEAENVFNLLAKRILGETASDIDILDFRHIRCDGELRARKLSKYEEITFDEIYSQCDFSGMTDIPNVLIQKIELQIEESVLNPIYDTLDHINALRKKGIKVAFISDMYLPSEFIEHQLKVHGFYKNGDSVYVSCNLRKTKRTGSLYRYVSEMENVEYSRWKHSGDNIQSDVRIPSKLGITAGHINSSYTYYEKKLLGKDLSLDNDNIKIAVGISKSIRQGREFSENLIFATDLIAPIYVSFVSCILRHAMTRGITDLFFLARDGYILFKIARILQSQYPNINLHYLYASRKSIYFSSMKDVNGITLEKIISDRQYLSIKERLDGLQMSFTDEFYKKAECASSISECIVNDNDTFTELTKWHTMQREYLINYFRQEGLASRGGKNAIVDLRGSRFTQRCINNILQDFNYNAVYGYYMEVQSDRVNSLHPDEYHASFSGDYILRNRNYKGLDNKAFIFEQYFSATADKRTSHYSFDGTAYVPIFDELEIPTEKSGKLQKLHTEICEEYARMALSLQILNNSKELLNYSLANLADFCVNPDRQCLKALLGIVVNDTQYSSKPIIKKLSLKDLIKGNTCIWYDGSVKFTYGYYAMLIFRKIQRIRRRLLN